MDKADSRDFRRALGCFVTGVTVVMTYDQENLPRGFTANSFSAVSLQPPLVSVCIDRGISSYKVFGECSSFSINILSESQRDVSNLFASKSRNKFANVAWRTSQLTRCPLLAGSVAWFDCVPYESLDVGDHLLLIGEVKDYGYSDKSPLSFCRGNYISFDLVQDILSQKTEHNLCIGCVLSRGNSVLLIRENNNWTFPRSDSLGSRNQGGGLYGMLRKRGISTDLSFLFSVFEGPGKDQLSIFYRGEITHLAETFDTDTCLFDYSEIPWDDLAHEGYRSMLRRYIEERRRFQFGIYVGSVDYGSVVGSKRG